MLRPLLCPAGAEEEIVVEGRGEVCLAEEAERLRCSGLGVDEVARRMGVDAAWVETVIVAPEKAENGPDR